jgi:general L-amino acid transport system substrate-binding protein
MILAPGWTEFTRRPFVIRTPCRLSLLMVLLGLGLGVPDARAGTIQDVQKRGYLRCGVLDDYPGFGFLDNQGNHQGFDVDFCRAIAAALKVDVRYTKLTGKTRFPALQSGQVDVVLMLVTATMSRETKLGLDFPAVNFYDGQAFMVRQRLGVKSARELNGASICLTSGTTGEINVADFFRANGMKYQAVMFERIEDADRAYDQGRCDAVTSQAANLAAHRATLKNAAEHVVLPELISKEPMGPVTRSTDRQWSQAVKYIVNALLFAEEKGITRSNVDAAVKQNKDPEVQRLLGATGTLGPDAGLPADWAVRALRAAGNYGEIFERNLGKATIFKMERGLNDLWSKGGLHYPPPFK